MPTSFQLSADIRISDNYCKVDLSISFSFLKNFLIFLNIPNISHLSRFASLFSFLQNFVILYIKIIIATFFFPLFQSLSYLSQNRYCLIFFKYFIDFIKLYTDNTIQVASIQLFFPLFFLVRQMKIKNK